MFYILNQLLKQKTFLFFYFLKYVNSDNFVLFKDVIFKDKTIEKISNKLFIKTHFFGNSKTQTNPK